jgi:hypothetical protein
VRPRPASAVDPPLPFGRGPPSQRAQAAAVRGRRRRGVSAYLHGLSRRPVAVSLFIGPEGLRGAEIGWHARRARSRPLGRGSCARDSGYRCCRVVLNALGEMGWGNQARGVAKSFIGSGRTGWLARRSASVMARI